MDANEAARAAAVRRMLEARSIAVVGASVREGSVGHQSLVEIRDGGFDGRVFPINPKYDDVLGWRCFPTIADVGEPVDLAILAVANALLEDQLRAAVDAGAGSAVIFASGYEEPREGVPSLTERLSVIAGEAGIALCGGNCMGFANIARRVRALGFYEPKDLRPGGLVFISHSGSAFSAMLHNDRGLGFDLAVSAGQELVTTAADYLGYALERDATRAVGLFIETVRDPDRFERALRRASERDIPVLALKVGRETLTRRMISAHSGALAGEDGAYEALFERHGVLRVDGLDEMADALALFASGRRAGPGGLASAHDSGGERALLVDAAASAGVPLARISERTTRRLSDLLEPGLDPVNPLDFWGTGRDAREVIVGSMRALLDDPDTAALAFAVDLTTEDSPDMGYIGMAAEVFAETDKPFAVLSSLSSGIDRSDVKELEVAGIPVLEGTTTGLAAFRHLFAYRDHRALPPFDGASPVGEATRERWSGRLASRDPFDEVEALELLADYGMPVVPSARASSLAEARAAAAALRWPVVLKTATPGIEHKSDVGGVVVGISDELALETAYAELASSLGPDVTIASMADAGVELALGVVRDAQFGPLVLVAAGGVLVEVLRDRRLAMPPLDVPRARRLIDRLAIRRLLDGVRGSPAADVDAVVRALVAVSWLATDLGDRLDALDVNPLICSPGGCVAVDALVIPRESASGGSIGPE